MEKSYINRYSPFEDSVAYCVIEGYSSDICDSVIINYQYSKLGSVVN